MDGVSAAASVLAIGTIGVQVSIKLIAFANQVGTASDRIQSIGSDVSLTANVLQQLSELMSKRDENEATSIFSENALTTTHASASACKKVFTELEEVLRKASKQLRASGHNAPPGQKIILSKYEALKWPFLQPSIASLRTALGDARETLMLILQVTTLAYSKKLAELNKPPNLLLDEQSQLTDAILAMHLQKAASTTDKANKTVTEGNVALPAPKGNETASVQSTSGPQATHVQNDTGEPSAPPTRSSSRSGVDRLPSNGTQENLPCAPPSSLFMCGPEVATYAKSTSIPQAVQETAYSEGLEGRGPGKKIRKSVHSLGDDGPSKCRKADSVAETETLMESWIVTPKVHEAEEVCGYDLRWDITVLPLEPQEVKRQIQKLYRWKKRNSIPHFADLTYMERKVLSRNLSERAAVNTPPHEFTVKSVGFQKMQPSKEPNTLMPWRCIRFLIARKASAFGGDISHMRHDLSFGAAPLVQPRPRPEYVYEQMHEQSQSYRHEHCSPQMLHGQTFIPPHHSQPQMSFQMQQACLDQHSHDNLADEIIRGQNYEYPAHVHNYQLPPRLINANLQAIPTNLRTRSYSRPGVTSSERASEVSRIFEDKYPRIQCMKIEGKSKRKRHSDVDTPPLDTPPATSSQQIIDELLKKYTTIYD